ncbi:MAG: hypothetical protein U0W24_02250 [Bacteroidales bacterium]
MKAKLTATLLILIYNISMVIAQENRWIINPSGSISWMVKAGDVHKDNIEMSGKFISAVVHYGVKEDQSFYTERKVVWPMLRTIPNNTHASLIHSFNIDIIDQLKVDKAKTNEKVTGFELNGKINVYSTLNNKLKLTRVMFPSAGLPVFCEKYTLTNISSKTVTVEVPAIDELFETRADKGVEGVYRLRTKCIHPGKKSIQPGQSENFYMVIYGSKNDGEFDNTDVEKELTKRNEFLNLVQNQLVLETPDSVLNTAFSFAKIRASESIYQTKGGPMHGPGGLSYYAAIWANDQAEYIGPFFPYLGYDYGVEASLNAYRHFARFMNPEYKPIPSSIIAEGTDIWNGAGDRGDAAMIAYGASRFALSQGDIRIAEELWSLIEWCLEFNKRKLNPQGVVGSDSDELEGRFPSGTANLCTSSLYYDALISAFYLGNALGKDEKTLDDYQKQAENLKINIEKYFGAKVQGFETYRYYDGNDKLRAWICIPLTVNIFDRKQGTIQALFSPELWTADGLASQSGDKTFWDRSTLYALRGVFAAGETVKGLQFLKYYSNRRLLGEHVPYPVEAYPEGNQRHLSAESGLYCRVYTEGLFGFRPAGLNSFYIAPQLPEGWNEMKLKNLHGFGKTFDVEVSREGELIRLKILNNGLTVYDEVMPNGNRALIELNK